MSAKGQRPDGRLRSLEMTTQVGIDLVHTDEVREAVLVHGERYLNRVYTEQERRDCGSDPWRLAARFAAKEAAMKALGRDGEPLPWRAIGVRTNASGASSLDLHGAAAALARRRGAVSLSVTLIHEGPLAAAVVLAELG
jgi:holo-[acyl-carrier protein] synthase